MFDFNKGTHPVPMPPYGLSGPATASTLTYVDRLKMRKQGLEEDLAKVNEAITALEANPEVTKLLDLVQATL